MCWLGIGDWEPEPAPASSSSSSSTIRIWCPDIHESVWTHLIVNFHASNLTVFINGRVTHTCKMDGPQRSKHSSTQHVFSAFVGTPPMWRKASRLCWKQGVAHLFEDFVVNQNTGYCVWKLGPSYLGSFQSVRLGGVVDGGGGDLRGGAGGGATGGVGGGGAGPGGAVKERTVVCTGGGGGSGSTLFKLNCFV